MIELALFVAAGVIAVYLLAPTTRRAAVPEGDPRAALEAGRAAVLRALRDLELDWATAKLAEEDYRSQRQSLEAEAAAIARQIAALTPPSP